MTSLIKRPLSGFWMCLLLLLGTQAHGARMIRVLPFDFDAVLPTDDSQGPSYTVDDLIKKALEFGMDSRQAIQILFQVRSAARIKLGDLLPQINASSLAYSAATSTPMASLGSESIFPLIGFLFPSRWYDYKSAKKLKKAEEATVATLFADTAQTIQHIYYDIQRQIWAIQILEFYTHQAEAMIQVLEGQYIDGVRRASEEDLAILENIRGQYASCRAYIDALSSVLPRLASAIGLSPHIDWKDLKVENHRIVPLTGHIFLREYDEFFDTALLKSTELKNVNFLLESAKKLKKGTYWDFFDPSSGNSLGFGYTHRIKVASSSVEFLKLQHMRTKMQISNAIQDALNNYNDSVAAIPAIEKALSKLPAISKAVEDHINDSTVPLDINRLIRYFQYAESQALLHINNYFIFKDAEADLNRYTWNGRIYDRVTEYKEIKVREFLQNVKKSHSLVRAFKRQMDKIGDLIFGSD